MAAKSTPMPTTRLWRLPFDLHASEASCLGKCLHLGAGMCVQGNHSGDTHVKELGWAFDWSLAVGTPILASASGTVAGAVSVFKVGNKSSKEIKARANYVALRHEPGLYTRYYHLREKGVTVPMGKDVTWGEPIGLSGNTGFSALGDHLEGRVLWAEPLTADGPLRNDPDAVRGAVVLVDRCPHVDFVEKARRAEAAGASAVLVVNYRDAGRGGLLTMGLPKEEPKRAFTVGIPALMVARDAADDISALIAAAAATGGEAPRLAIGRSPHFVARSEMLTRRAEEEPTLTQSDYVPLSLPARFAWPGREEGYLPRAGETPPRAVQRATANDYYEGLDVHIMGPVGEAAMRPASPPPA